MTSRATTTAQAFSTASRRRGGVDVGVEERVAGPDGGVALDTEAGESVARGGHEVLVADEAAEAAGGRVIGVQVGAIAHAPDGALGEGRDELAVAPEEPAVGTEVAERVVERASRPLGHAYDDRGVRPPGGFAQRLRLGAGHLDAVLREVAEERAHGAGGSLLGAPVGVARQPRLGQDDESGALARRLVDGVDGAPHARLQVAVRGRPLHSGGDVGARGGQRSCWHCTGRGKGGA